MGPASRFAVGVVAVGTLMTVGAAAAESQEGEVAGTVTDSVSRRPIVGVDVTILSSTGDVVASVRTNRSGAYRAARIAAGRYTVRFALLGWMPEELAGVQVVPDEISDLSVLLVPQPIPLPGVSTVARGSQPLLEAPASVSVRNRSELTRQPQLTLLEQFRRMAGVDIIRTGLVEGQVVARGFNRLFNGRLLLLTDGRVTRVPGVRSDRQAQMPVTSFDLDRIELVRGPVSALYGPDAADGVLQVFTKSAFEDPGAALALSGGVRQQGPVRGFGASADGLFELEGRVAVARSPRWGMKLSGRWFRGTEWRYLDPVEDTQRGAAEACLEALSETNPACQSLGGDGVTTPNPERLARIGQRDFNLENAALDARADWAPNARTSLSFSSGFGWIGGEIAQTNAGATQVERSWSWYGQARLTSGELSTQAYVTHAVLADAYDLRTGAKIASRSTLLAAQLQHRFSVTDRERLVYGGDAQTTFLDTHATGIYRDDDDSGIAGVFIQSETDLSPRWRLVVAGRVDTHSVLPEAVVSPGAALMFKPGRGHRLRITYNRAFTTPLPLAFFADRSLGRVPLVGPFAYGLRSQGSAGHGFTFERIGGRPAMKSPLAALIGADPTGYLPATTGQLYVLAREYLRSTGSPRAAVMDAVGVPTEADVDVVPVLLNPATGERDPLPGGFASIHDIPPLEQETTTTLELGYRGVLGDRALVSVDTYHTKKSGFIGFSLASPNVVLDGEALARFFMSHGVDEDSARALAIGTPDQPGLSSLPLGVITPSGVSDPQPTLLSTARNFGDVDVFGAEFSLYLHLSDRWSTAWDVSAVSEDAFDADGLEIALNAPRFTSRVSLLRRSRDGLDLSVHYRYSNGYPARSGVFVGKVDAAHVVDMGAGYRLPGRADVRLQIDIQNLFDVGYRTFVGAPRLGRLAIARVVWGS